jgi:hypothetical protein
LKALVRDGDVETGGLGHDGGIGAPFRDQRFGSDAGVLFVRDGGDDDAATIESAGFDDAPDRGDHRRDAALHVLRAAAIEPAVANLGLERPRHAGDTDGIGVAAEHQRSARRATVKYADDVRASRRSIGDLHLETDRFELARNSPGDVGLATCTCRQRRIDRVDRDEIAQQRDGRVYSHNRRVNGTTAPGVICDIARAARDVGGRALIVGGWVRDALLTQGVTKSPTSPRPNRDPKPRAQSPKPSDAIDIDIEVFGIAEDQLPSLLESFGRVEAVGSSFPVYKLVVPDSISAPSTSRCPAANRRAAVDTRASRSAAIRRCQSPTQPDDATSESTRSPSIR